ncbi:MFS transporter [Marinoscillum sp. MHG1-6]|uniref:MFS transporter n=1 Tax=Marinoscillum sp. MHG1-6 TaxID=2959627 RepID=UPI0021575EC1|nr:MFS transporter [Marinoscillum sp. MHG1-6]
MALRNWANVPFHPGKWPFFYGWMILVWGTIGVIMSVPGQTIGVSAFTDSLIEVLGISRDDLSLSYMFGTIASSFMLPWAGRQYDKHGVRLVALVASVALGLVLFLLSHIDVVIFDLLNIQSNIIIISVMFVCFLLLRFFGQGVITMTSRNMMVQWFDKRRGFATGFSNIFISMAFSGSPVLLFYLVDQYSWSGAWQVMGLVLLFAFPIIILIFFRNKPEDSGLVPDGAYVPSVQKQKLLFPIVHEFTLEEARRNSSFWIYTFMLAMQGLYITAFTFHVVSIFETAGLSEEQAIAVFPQTAVVAVLVTLIFSSVSDFVQLKYLYILMGIGACLGILGLVFLSDFVMSYYLMVIGHGVMGGLFSVLSSVTWPRYFGRLHLGAISGQSIMVIVFGSALGPIILSQSLTHFGNYAVGGWICFFIYLVLTIASVRTNNPQKLMAKP